MKNLILVLLVIAGFSSMAQTTEAEEALTTQNKDTVMGWKKGGLINISASQVSLTNWAAGGANSISLNGILNLYANLKREKFTWENSLDVGYGIIKQGDADWFKSDDKIDFTSKYGRKLKKSLYLAGLVNFRTQMDRGFNSPGDTVAISNLMAPGYGLAALGLEYKPNDRFGVFIAPVTGKFTFVLDESLSNAGAFGVEKGESLRTELGGYLRAIYNHPDIVKNVNFTTRLELFSNYLEDPSVLDVNWETLIGMKVNKFLTVSLNTVLIYDQDIDIITGKNDDQGQPIIGPRVQFKEVLGVGLSYQF